jgi:two-component system, OmpR family, alkaline phosphatase synthesis response regulator PhoP
MSSPTEQHRILCIDNDVNEREILSERLKYNGFLIEKSGIQDFNALEIKRIQPVIILLGINQFEDLDTLKKLKTDNITKEIPVFVYSAINDEYFEVSVYRNGADDFILKPLRIIAFISKIIAFIGKKSKREIKNKIIVNDLEINPDNLSVRFSTGKTLHLPKKEFTLISYLAEHAGQIFNRNDLLNRIWGEDVFIGERTVDVHIRRLREKIGEGYIITLKGVGYMFQK